MKIILWIMAAPLVGAWVISMGSSAIGSNQAAILAWIGIGLLLGLGWALHLLEKIVRKA